MKIKMNHNSYKQCVYNELCNEKSMVNQFLFVSTLGGFSL